MSTPLEIREAFVRGEKLTPSMVASLSSDEILGLVERFDTVSDGYRRLVDLLAALGPEKRRDAGLKGVPSEISSILDGGSGSSPLLEAAVRSLVLIVYGTGAIDERSNPVMGGISVFLSFPAPIRTVVRRAWVEVAAMDDKPDSSGFSVSELARETLRELDRHPQLTRVDNAQT